MRNSVGKTTTLRLLLGLVAPTAGSELTGGRGETLEAAFLWLTSNQPRRPGAVTPAGN